jgi:hypothetical protein
MATVTKDKINLDFIGAGTDLNMIRIARFPRYFGVRCFRKRQGYILLLSAASLFRSLISLILWMAAKERREHKGSGFSSRTFRCTAIFQNRSFWRRFSTTDYTDCTDWKDETRVIWSNSFIRVIGG